MTLKVIADEDWDAENRRSNTKAVGLRVAPPVLGNPTIVVEKKMVIRRDFDGTPAQRKALVYNHNSTTCPFTGCLRAVTFS